MKKSVSMTIDARILSDIDRIAEKVGINRSQMIENLCAVALVDARIFEDLRLLDLASRIRKFQDRAWKLKSAL